MPMRRSILLGAVLKLKLRSGSRRVLPHLRRRLFCLQFVCCFFGVYLIWLKFPCGLQQSVYKDVCVYESHEQPISSETLREPCANRKGQLFNQLRLNRSTVLSQYL
jgi:hypothetical protein